MPDYKTMYFHLFNYITDALTEMERRNYDAAASLLIHAQQEGEELYISGQDED